jgi:hypothetical protein
MSLLADRHLFFLGGMNLMIFRDFFEGFEAPKKPRKNHSAG